MKRQVPPGLTSIFSTIVVLFLNPHHCGIKFGSVCALNTSSRGASKMRVITTSRSERIVNVELELFFAGMFTLLFLNFLQKLIEAVETFAPQLLEGVDPVSDRFKLVRIYSIHVLTTYASFTHQANLFQHPKMF